MNELYHHGIIGQKWGVRRYQNPDGTLTEEGKARLRSANNFRRNVKYVDDMNVIYRTLSDKEKRMIYGMYKSSKEESTPKDFIDEDYKYEVVSNIAKTFVEYYNDVPVSQLSIWVGKTYDGKRIGQIAISTSKDEKYRGKGYASKNVEKALDWINRYGYKTIDELEWSALKENTKSINLAKKYGFKEADDIDDDTKDHFIFLTKDVRKTR